MDLKQKVKDLGKMIGQNIIYHAGEKIYNDNIEIGKVLINGKFPFALIKFLDKNLNKELICESESGLLKIIVPQWLKSKIN